MSDGTAGPDRGGEAPPPAPLRPRDDPAATGQEQGPGPADSGNTALPQAEAEARIAELEDQRLRALADLDNLRKRCAGQLTRAEAETRAEVARRWLPVVDNLDLAVRHAEADPGALMEGIRAVREQATSVLAQLGFPARDDVGASFDPSRHEAVASRPDPAVPDGTVVEVVRAGYGDGERQLRPAQVVVARSE
jgi:molecular chaperone GrpE